MIYKKEDLEKLNMELDIVKVIGEYVELKKAGISYKGLCPFHKENTPSFHVTPSKNIYKCFGCNAGGSAIDFYMNYNNLDYITAVKELSEKYDVDIKPVKGDYDFKTENDEIYYKILEDALNIFIENIYNESGKEALEYLKKRDLDDKFIQKYNIGYSQNSWNDLLNKLIEKGYDEEAIIEAGLAKRGEKGVYDVFRGRIMFPIYSHLGKIIGFGGRIIEDKKDVAKYLNSPETDIFKKGNNLYGLIEKGIKIRKNDYAILVEGYMDVISSHIYGFDMSVATLGTSLTDNQAKLLKKYTNNIIIAYDMDEAGRNATERAAYILKKYDFNIRILELEGAKDPDEYLKKYGKEDFIIQLKKSKEIFDFLYSNYAKMVDINSIIGKRKFIEKFSEFFKNINNRIEYSLYMDKLSKNTEVSTSVLEEYLKYNDNIEKNEIISNKSDKNEKHDYLELSTVRLILKKKEYLKEFKDIKIEDKLLKKIINFIKENIDNENIEYILLNNKEFEEIEKEKIVNIIYSAESIDNPIQYFEEIKLRWEIAEKQKREKEISQILKEEDLTPDERKNLIYERVEIIKSLKRNF